MQNLFNLLKRYFSIILALGHNAADSIESQVNILDQKVREEETKVKKAEDALTDIMAQLQLVKGDERHAEEERIRFETLAVTAHEKGNMEDANEFAQKAEEWSTQEKIYEEQIVMLEETVEQLTQTVDDAINRIGKMNNQIKSVQAQAKANNASLSIAKTMSDLDSDGLTGSLKAVQEKSNLDREKARAMLKRQDKRASTDSKASAYESGTNGSGSALDRILASKQTTKTEEAAA